MYWIRLLARLPGMPAKRPPDARYDNPDVILLCHLQPGFQVCCFKEGQLQGVIPLEENPLQTDMMCSFLLQQDITQIDTSSFEYSCVNLVF